MTGEGVVTKAAGDVNSSSVPITETVENCVNVVPVSNGGKKSDSNSKSEYGMQDLVDMLSKLNPMAEEFFPSRYSNDRNQDQFGVTFFVPAQKNLGNDGQTNNRRV